MQRSALHLFERHWASTEQAAPTGLSVAPQKFHLSVRLWQIDRAL